MKPCAVSLNRGHLAQPRLQIGLVGHRVALRVIGQIVDRAPRVVGLLLTPAERDVDRIGPNAVAYPGARFDHTVRRLDPRHLAVRDAQLGRLVRVHLHVEVRPHFLCLPEIMGPGMEMRRRRPAGDEFGVVALCPQPRTGGIVRPLYDARRPVVGPTLREHRGLFHPANLTLTLDIGQFDELLPFAVKFRKRRQSDFRERGFLLLGPEFELAGLSRKAFAFRLAERRGAFEIHRLRRFAVLVHGKAQCTRRAGPKRFRRAPAQEGTAGAHLVPKGACVLVFLFQHIAETQSLAQLDPDPAIRPCLARRFDQLVVPDNATFLRSPSDMFSEEVTPDFSLFDVSIPKAVANLNGQMWCPDFKDVTSEIVQEAHDLGLIVCAWTVNEIEDLKNMIATGVDGIITDYPDRAQKVLNASGLNW